MNTKTLFILSLLIASTAIARTEAYQKELNEALFGDGAQAKVIFCVKDLDENAIDKAYIRAGFWLSKKKGNGVLGYTDERGRLHAEKYANRDVNYWIEKSNYYVTRGRYNLSRLDGVSVKDGKWIPYGKEIDVILKPMKNPIPMYIGGRYPGLMFPKQGIPIGLDLIKQDWTPPYGKGEVADFTVTFTLTSKEGGRWYEKACTLSMQFPHELDGAHRLKQDLFSDFKSVYHADPNAHYQKQFDFVHDAISTPKIEISIGEDEYLILRTRTKVDNEGNLIETHYSKIYGPIRFLGSLQYGGTSFNPTPNDTNLEGDIKKNLLPEQSSSIQP